MVGGLVPWGTDSGGGNVRVVRIPRVTPGYGSVELATKLAETGVTPRNGTVARPESETLSDTSKTFDQ